MKFAKSLFVCLFSTLFISGCVTDVIPEMKECMKAHGSIKNYRSVIAKYASPELQQDLSICCMLEGSKIIGSEKNGDITYFLEEGRLPETSVEIPSQTIQIIKVGWTNKKIFSLEFLGAKKSHEQKYLKSDEQKKRESLITG